MKSPALSVLLAPLMMAVISTGYAQQPTSLDRLPLELLDITAPSERISGAPGEMRITQRACRTLPIGEVRRRIVNAVVQEWAFFGFSINDMTRLETPNPSAPRSRRRFFRMSVDEASRVADSIAGYWAATPDSSWILQQQNESWNTRGITSRWRNPWSAAFISWVMCESGLGDSDQFQRAIAHYTYIDQAILSRDTNDSEAAFSAYDPGEAALVPGDLLCRASRPAYRTIAQRREHLGEGARTHCDIVVKVDQEAAQIMVIGGNVRGSVRMKLLPASSNGNQVFGPVPYGGRRIFSHLKLKTEPIEADALDNSPTMHALSCNTLQISASVIAVNRAVKLSTSC